MPTVKATNAHSNVVEPLPVWGLLQIVFVVRDHEVANDLFQDTWIKVVKVLKSGKYVEEESLAPG